MRMQHPSHAGLFFQEPTPSAQAEAAQEFSIPPAPEPPADTDVAGDWEQDFSIEMPQPAGESASANRRSSEVTEEVSAGSSRPKCRPI